MKLLSDAILDGCKDTTKAVYNFVMPVSSKLGKKLGACVLGAGALAVDKERTLVITEYSSGDMAEEAEIVQLLAEHTSSEVIYQDATCPIEGCFSSLGLAKVWRIAEHLNDEHSWEREKIATEFILPIEEKLGLVEIIGEEDSCPNKPMDTTDTIMEETKMERAPALIQV